MSNKKPIIIAVILSLIIIAAGWYYSTHKNPNNTPNPQQSASASPLANATEQGISYGNPDAPVTVEEYTNFLCPACASFAADTFLKIKDAYIATGKVRFIFYIFPPFELSQAALCAVEQNKFIEYHDYVFSHQTQISGEQELKDFAVNVGMDSQKFNDCYASDKYQDKVQKWLDEGQARGVEVTPTFFVNGQKFVGAQPYAEFQKLIDQKLNQ